MIVQKFQQQNRIHLQENQGHMLYVYTYDWTDENDVKRNREELRKLGITNKIPYKADEDTLKGKYRITGHRR